MLDTVSDALVRFWDQYNTEMLISVAIIIGALVVIWFVRRSIKHWHGRVVHRLAGSHDQEDREKAQRFKTLSGVVMVVVLVTVWSVVILTIMSVWGIPMAPFLAVGTTVGIAVGFGAQDVVRDVIAIAARGIDRVADDAACSERHPRRGGEVTGQDQTEALVPFGNRRRVHLDSVHTRRRGVDQDLLLDVE